MQAKLDHVVLWVADPSRSLEFYERVVGLTPVRAEEFREGKAPFPSVRVSSDSIIDLMAKVAAPIIDHMVGVHGTAGNLVNHVCIAMSRDDIEALRKRLADAGVGVSTVMTNSFGPAGWLPRRSTSAILTTTSPRRGSTNRAPSSGRALGPQPAVVLRRRSSVGFRFPWKTATTSTSSG